MSVFMQIAFAVIGWFIMLIACCSVCLGVRHLRKSEQENREQYYVGGYPPQSAEGFKE